ncbi:MAG: pyruvate dehydrogenase complex dihydrolipoamide acetyltransferase [Acidobacteriota bacterium]|nr:pyruvate dehydrogenase complex dihydrolipoamide acetyltransferase [Acidobacteriota bacterium]
MAEKFLMPKLSPTMEEGQIARWLKKEGESFKNGETLAEVDTDKATMEMTALNDGVVLKILKGDGETVPLGDPIAIIGKEGEDISALLSEVGGGNGASAAKPAETKAEPQTASQQMGTPVSEKPEVAEAAGRSYDAQRPGAEQQGQTAPQQIETKTSDGGNGRLIISPIAARMAAEAGLDLHSLQGSGPGGRIIKRDIETALANQKATPQVQPQAQLQIQEEQPAPAAFQAPAIEGASPYREEPTTQMRRAIASRLVESIGPVPTFYLTIEVEMDKAIDFRKQINAALPEDRKVSINDVIIKCVASALMQHPQANASYQDRSIRYFERADIGVAVAIPDGLITPIIRNANAKGIAQIASEVKELAGRARDKKLKPEEFTGGTFSISNLGMFGIEEFTAIINPPEAGILAIGKSEPKPVVRDGEIVVRNMMRVTMSCDHRVIDGATGAKFLKTLKQMLENPMLMLM